MKIIFILGRYSIYTKDKRSGHLMAVVNDAFVHHDGESQLKVITK